MDIIPVFLRFLHDKVELNNILAIIAQWAFLKARTDIRVYR